jgi:hypothetical protein
MLSGGTVSTLEPVDGGCTTNNSTPAMSACYDARRHSPRPSITEAPPPLAPAQPPLKLAGIAEDETPEGVVRTAIISGEGQLFMVKEGEMVTARYQVVKISADVVELQDATDKSVRRLALR